MASYGLPELAARWTRGLKVWTLVQVAVGSTHHLGVLQVALHIKYVDKWNRLNLIKKTDTLLAICPMFIYVSP